MPPLLTPRETAFVVERDIRDVQRAVDGGVVRRRTRRRGGRTERVFGRPELRFFRALRDVEGTLTPEGRRRWYQAFQRVRAGRARVGPLEVDVADLDRRIERRVAELEVVRGAVEDGPDGEPVLRGTSVPVYVVAALAAGEGVDGAARAYPSLSRAAIERAAAYAELYPKRGRPYPAASLKAMLAGLGLPDEVFDDAEDASVTPEATGGGPHEIRL